MPQSSEQMQALLDALAASGAQMPQGVQAPAPMQGAPEAVLQDYQQNRMSVLDAQPAVTDMPSLMNALAGHNPNMPQDVQQAQQMQNAVNSAVIGGVKPISSVKVLPTARDLEEMALKAKGRAKLAANQANEAMMDKASNRQVLDYSKFKKPKFAHGGEVYKIKSHAKGKTIFEHADGHEVHLAHGGFTDEDHSYISQMLAEGGEVQDQPTEVAQSYDIPTSLDPQQIEPQPLPFMQGVPQQVNPDMSEPLGQYQASGNPLLPGGPSAFQPMPVADSFAREGGEPSLSGPAIQGTKPIEDAASMGKYAAVQGDAFSRMKSAYDKTANAQAQMYQQQTGILGEQAQQQAQRETDYQASNESLQAERESFIQDIKDKHIDPDRYMNSKSTAGKLSTAIGLVLGGLGAGLTGQPNAGLAILQKQIDNDIMSQKAELDKGQNLLSANMRQFGNLKDATAMTSIMHNDYVKHMIDVTAAKSNSVQVKQQAEIMKAELDQKSMMLQMQLALAAPAQSSEAAMRKAQLLQVVAPDKADAYRERIVPGYGEAAIKPAQEVRSQIEARTTLQGAINDLLAFSQQNSGSVNPAVQNAGVAKARMVQDLYRRANAQGTFKESEAEFVNSIIKDDPTVFFSKFRSQPGYREALKGNERELNGILSGVGLKPQQGHGAPAASPIRFKPRK